MPSSWTIPPTWQAGIKDQPTLTDYNNLLRDNLLYLLGGKDIAFKEYIGTDKTTTGTSFAAMHATDFTLTSGIINSSRYLVVMSAEWAVTGLNSKIYADMYVDGAVTRANNGNPTNGIISFNNLNVNSDRLLMLALFTGLSVATHQFTPFMKVSAGTGTILTSLTQMQMIGMEV